MLAHWIRGHWPIGVAFLASVLGCESHTDRSPKAPTAGTGSNPPGHEPSAIGSLNSTPTVSQSPAAVEPARTNNGSVEATPSASVPRSLPTNYRNLSQSRLLQLLGNKERCVQDKEMWQERFVQVVDLGQNQSKLLLIACELGAYQDSRLAYLVGATDTGVTASLLTWQIPIFEGKWLLKSSTRFVGSLEIDPQSRRLQSSRLYAAFGGCGYRVEYSIGSLPLRPVAVAALWADNDCDNGVMLENWPRIHLPLPKKSGVSQ